MTLALRSSGRMLKCDRANACANFREGDKEGDHDWFSNNRNRSCTFPPDRALIKSATNRMVAAPSHGSTHIKEGEPTLT
jgi:hypothetical protein